MQIVAGGRQGSQAACIGQRGALKQRRSDAGDDEHGKKGELEAGAKEGIGIGDEHSDGGRSDGVEHIAIAIEQAGSQINGQHQGGAPDRRPDPDHERVRERDHDGGDCG